MSIFSYQIFDTVAKQGNFQRAAEEMNLTPSAISHSISSLEDKLGFPLFHRSRTGVTLTNEGTTMLKYVREILNREDQLEQEAAQINGLEKGTVILGTFASVCVHWIPEIVKSFHTLYPNIEINIMQGDYEDVISWVKAGTVNIGFATLPVNESKLEETPLGTDRLLCITPKSFHPSHPGYVTINDIKSQPLILQQKGYQTDTLAFIKKYHLSTHSRFFVQDDRSIVAIVESGLGISIVPELILNKEDYDVNIYPIRPNEFRTIGLITYQKQVLSPATLRMLNHIVSCVKNITGNQPKVE